jgi:hypothetical protein
MTTLPTTGPLILRQQQQPQEMTNNTTTKRSAANTPTTSTMPKKIYRDKLNQHIYALDDDATPGPKAKRKKPQILENARKRIDDQKKTIAELTKENKLLSAKSQNLLKTKPIYKIYYLCEPNFWDIAHNLIQDGIEYIASSDPTPLSTLSNFSITFTFSKPNFPDLGYDCCIGIIFEANNSANFPKSQNLEKKISNTVSRATLWSDIERLTDDYFERPDLTPSNPCDFSIKFEIKAIDGEYDKMHCSITTIETAACGIMPGTTPSVACIRVSLVKKEIDKKKDKIIDSINN